MWTFSVKPFWILILSLFKIQFLINLHKPDTLGELVPNGIEITIQYTQVCWNIWDAIFCVRFRGPLTENVPQWRDRMGSPFGSPNACNIQIGHIPSFTFFSLTDYLCYTYRSCLFTYLVFIVVTCSGKEWVICTAYYNLEVKLYSHSQSTETFKKPLKPSASKNHGLNTSRQVQHQVAYML